MSLRSSIVLTFALLLPFAARPAEQPKPAAAKPAAPAQVAAQVAAQVPAPAVATAPAPGAAEALPMVHLTAPLFDESFAKTPIARVEGEIIALEEYTEAIQQAHLTGGHGGPAKVARRDYAAMVDRLVNSRLVVAEARVMGIDELPETKEALEGTRERAQIRLLQDRVLKDVAADPKQVDRLYKDAVQEWNLRSVLFADPRLAQAFVAEAKGADFKAACAKAVAEKRASGGEASGFVKPSALAPRVAQVVGQLAKGQVAPPVQVEKGWTVVQLEDVRWPEDAKALELARAQASTVAKTEALRKVLAEILKRYVVRNEALLRSIDFDKPRGGPEAIEKDKRVVARVKGGQDVTVGELAKTLHGALYHGVEGAQKSKRIDKTKGGTLDDLLAKRVLPLEAARLGLLDTAEYRRAMRDGENAYLFGAFVRRVVAPEVVVKPEEEQAYYDAHKADFVYPAFYKLDAIGFGKLADAQAAAVKLRQGTDLKFLQGNADGQVPALEAALKLDGTATLSAGALPEGLGKLLEGARPGDVRVYTASEAQHFAVVVNQVTPPAPQPIGEVREGIQAKVFGEGLTRALEDWFKKLRASRKVEIFLEQLGG